MGFRGGQGVGVSEVRWEQHAMEIMTERKECEE